MLPKKKQSKEESELSFLLLERYNLKEQMSTLQSEWNTVNERILHLMKEMGKRKVETKNGIVTKIVVKSYNWKEDAISAWYEKKGLRLPFKKVRLFQPDKLEQDITTGKVPRKMLQKWADVSIKSTYIRVDSK